MAPFFRTDDDHADVKMMIKLHETIAHLLKTPGLADIIGNLDFRDFRMNLRSGLESAPEETLKRMGVTLPPGGKAIIQTEGEAWRVELHVPLDAHKLVFGLDSLTGYFDELRAL